MVEKIIMICWCFSVYTWLDQECTMTSFLLQRVEEECVTAKKLKQAKSPMCTINRTHLPKVCHSTILNLTTHCYSCNQLDVSIQAYRLTSSGYTGMVLGPSWCNGLCFVMLSMPESQRGLRSLSVKLLSFSLVNLHTSYNSTRSAIYSTHRWFCFHHAKNRKLHALPLPSTIKQYHHALNWMSKCNCTNYTIWEYFQRM